jgi:hypothetical protein
VSKCIHAGARSSAALAHAGHPTWAAHRVRLLRRENAGGGERVNDSSELERSGGRPRAGRNFQSRPGGQEGSAGELDSSPFGCSRLHECLGWCCWLKELQHAGRGYASGQVELPTERGPVCYKLGASRALFTSEPAFALAPTTCTSCV